MVNPTVQNNFHSLAYVYIYAQSLQSCMTLCNSMDCRPSGSSVHGSLQARILEWVAVPSSRGSSPPRDRTHISYCLLHWQVGSFTAGATWEALFWAPRIDLMEENFSMDTG